MVHLIQPSFLVIVSIPWLHSALITLMHCVRFTEHMKPIFLRNLTLFANCLFRFSFTFINLEAVIIGCWMFLFLKKWSSEEEFGWSKIRPYYIYTQENKANKLSTVICSLSSWFTVILNIVLQSRVLPIVVLFHLCLFVC